VVSFEFDSARLGFTHSRIYFGWVEATESRAT